MKHRLLALVLCLALLVTGTAYAAPTRDQQHSEITVTDTLQAFLDLVMGAAVLKGETALENGAVPSQRYVEGVFGVGLYSLVLPYEGDDIWQNRAMLTEEELQSLYGMVFSAGSYTVPESSDCDCIMINEKDVAFDLSPLAEQPAVGAYVYKTAFDGSIATLACDLFTHYGALSTSAADVPDDALTWYANATVTLKTDDKAPYGYLLVGFEIGAPYVDGMVSEWKPVEHEKLGLSVTVPSVFGLAEMKDDSMVLQTADGSAMITVSALEIEALGFEKFLEEYAKANEDKVIRADRAFEQFTSEDEDEFSVFIIDEAANKVYQLFMEFPASSAAEYSLYGEFIRNSFVVWSLANG